MRWLFIFVINFEHKIESLKTIWAPVSHKVTGHEWVVERPGAQQVAGALTLDTNDLLRNVHQQTVSAAGLGR